MTHQISLIVLEYEQLVALLDVVGEGVREHERPSEMMKFQKLELSILFKDEEEFFFRRRVNKTRLSLF